jgi:hypothetical protein
MAVPLPSLFVAKRARRADAYDGLARAAGVMLLLSIIGCAARGWSVDWTRSIYPIGSAFALLIPLLVARYRRHAAIRATCLSLFLFGSYALCAATVSYLIVSADLPLVDRTLAGWDRALGFDWPAVFSWFMRHQVLNHLLGAAYTSAIGLIVALIIYLNFTERIADLKEFFGAFVLSNSLTMIAGGLFPAEGASKYFWNRVHPDVSMLSNFEPLRAGTLTNIDLMNVQGLIAAPSFHTITAVLLIYSMRHTRLRYLYAVFGTAIIVSTPVHGGHYLVDILSGLATAAVSIWAVRRARVNH